MPQMVTREARGHDLTKVGETRCGNDAPLWMLVYMHRRHGIVTPKLPPNDFCELVAS